MEHLRDLGRGLTLQARAVVARGEGLLRGGRKSGPRKPTPRWRSLGRLSAVLTVIVALIALTCGLAWWRLGNGPLALDVATPWLTAALEEKLGNGHQVQVGGTILERGEDGRTAVRLQDIVVRDADGGVVARAPKAEIGIGAAGLLTGNIRAERLKLIGAEMSVRIDRAGRVAVFAAPGEERPLTSIAPAEEPSAAERDIAQGMAAAAGGSPAPGLMTAFMAWLRSLDAAGLDGRDLSEIGLQNGTLAVDDVRSGRRLTFNNIHLNVARLPEGGAAVAVASTGTDGPWRFSATVRPMPDGSRTVEAVVQDVSPKDIMLAMRMTDADFQADVPISAMLQAEIGKDGRLQMMRGRMLAGAGRIGDIADPNASILIDEFKAELRWDPAQRTLQVPLEIYAGANRFTLLGQLQALDPAGQNWSFAIPQGVLVLASLDRHKEQPLILDRINVRGRLDMSARRLDIEQLDMHGNGAGLVVSGTIDGAGDSPQLMLGLAATRMGATAFQRLWPAIVAPELREWVQRYVDEGTLERLVVATNLPLSAMKRDSPPLSKEALSVELVAKDVTVRPIEGLPPIRGADIAATVTGRDAKVAVENGSVTLASGRKLQLSAGMFEVLDMAAKPMGTRTTFRIDGGADAVAELLDAAPLRGASTTVPADFSSARGNVSARIAVALPLIKDIQQSDVSYAVEGEIANFSADKVLAGQKAEAASLRVNATQNAVHIRGDIRIAGAPANLDYRIPAGASEGEIRLQATLDEAARNRLGLDFGGALSGPVAVKLSGRKSVKAGGAVGLEGRFQVEADLTQARLDELMPGWIKAAGRPARLSFTLIEHGGTKRLEDFVLEGSGATARGTIELDAKGELVSAHLPTFAISDGDKASLRAERGNDGVMRITLRGDVYDGRGLIKGTVAGQRGDQRGHRAPDLDIEIKLGAMTGFHGEALRSVDLRLTRRAGQIRVFSMNGRLGRDARIKGDLRTRGAGRQVLYLESNDAGALFRFMDIYPRIIGGTVSVAMDPPVLNEAPREGLLNIRDFEVRGEPALDRVASSGGQPGDPSSGRGAAVGRSGVAFSRLRAEFTRSPGRFSIREGVVWGPAIGATVDGSIDYARDEVRMRGTFVPAYGLNNMFSRLPVLGLFLGGNENEGLLGVTFQVVGSPKAPVLQVNMMSAVAPGILRKLFEFRGTGGQTGQIPDPIRER